MTYVIPFVPKEAVDAALNLRDFVKVCRDDVKVFPSVDWIDDGWDLSKYIAVTGKGKGRIRIVFESLQDDGIPYAPAMDPEFKEFAKAYIKFSFGMRPTNNLNIRIMALRIFEAALSRAGEVRKISNADAALFNIAANLVRSRYSGSAYGIGKELEKIAALLSSKRLVVRPFNWRSPIKRENDKNRVGAEADQKRAEKLPSQAALDALPKCFTLAEEFPDVIVTSIAALLCSAPDRISEVFSLPVECEVEQEHKGKMRYGLRWWPEKGAEPMIKWIVGSMADVVKEAIRRLRVATAPAREVAEWYVRNPEKLYLRPELEHLRTCEMLRLAEVGDVLGLPYGAVSTWCMSNGVDRFPLSEQRNEKGVYFRDLESAVIKLLPKEFPIICQRTKLLYSDALLVMRRNDMHQQRGTIVCLVDPISTNVVNAGLGAKVEHGAGSVFSRMGFTEPDGSPIRVSTHQFRHWLNTLAQRGGMSQIDIAKWSGRVEVRQNRAYDHMSGDELVAMARELDDKDGRLYGALAEFVVKAPVSRGEFLELEFPTAHATEIGFCVHDYVMAPCEMHRDCINCNDHVCVKGDRAKTSRVLENLQIAEKQRAGAEKAIQDGYYGAERWFEHHDLTVARLKNLVQILEDPEIPVGSIIKLANPKAMPVTRLAIEDRRDSGAQSRDRSAQDLIDEARILIGG